VTSINDNGKLIYEGYEVQGRFNGSGKYYEDGKLDFAGEFKDGQPVQSN
jgi:antitoxin component YwqK of YwqJK toxin-antitoxin module